MQVLPITPARPFDPHRRAATEAMKSLVGEVKQQLSGYEYYYQTRKRKRSERAQHSYDKIVEAVVCDTVHRELEQPGGKVHVSQCNQILRRKSRYKGEALGKVLPDVLRVMSAKEMNFLSITPGRRGSSGEVIGTKFEIKGKQTTIRITGKILKRMENIGITFADIRRSQSEEVIELREPKERNDKAGALVEYSDTEETIRLRGELRSINKWLEGADIECELSSTADRRLKRVFNNSDFGQGGRLYGGFWQKMKSEDRLASIIIDDDSVVELDYGQMGLLLLYGLAGATPPSGDLYDLSTYGIPYSCRPGLKKVIQAAINSDKRLSRMPRGARKTIPKRFSLECILSAVSEHHSEVCRYFGSGVGMKIMRLESDILVQVLLSLKAKGITALPVHDAILVNANFEEAAREVMIEEFRKKTGLIPEVNTEHP